MNERKQYSQLKAMLAISVASFISILRSPSSVVFTIIFPLIFIIAFGFMGNRPISVKIALSPQTDTSGPIINKLQQIEFVSFTKDIDSAKIIADLQKGLTDGWLHIEKVEKNGQDFYEINLITSSAAKERGDLFATTLQQVLDKMNLEKANIQQVVAEIKQEEVQGRKFNMIDFILPGQLGFSLLSTGVFSTAFVFLSFRQTLVIKRFFATPIHRLYIVLGEALSRLVFSLLGSLTVILIGYYFFGFTLIHGAYTVLQMLLLSALGLITFMGFGFTISGIAKNESTVPPLANIITLPQFLLSGTFFSIDVFPAWLQTISNLLPLTYLNNALRKISFEGATLWGVKEDILILLIWGIVAYFLASKTFRWE